MAKSIHFGAGSVKNVKEIYIGAGGVKKVKAGYIGTAGVKQFYTSNVDIVLWDGVNLCNGCYWDDHNPRRTYRLWYDFTPGSISDKSIVLKLKKNSTYSNFVVFSKKNGTTTKWAYLSTDGRQIGSNNSDSWKANTEYIFKISDINFCEGAYTISILFNKVWDDGSADHLYFSEYISYLALRG